MRLGIFSIESETFGGSYNTNFLWARFVLILWILKKNRH